MDIHKATNTAESNIHAKSLIVGVVFERQVGIARKITDADRKMFIHWMYGEAIRVNIDRVKAATMAFSSYVEQIGICAGEEATHTDVVKTKLPKMNWR